MTELILHHYDFSPFAEKIRLAFGLKGLAWRSVVQPSYLPKPDLLPLTGGYRHIPVMQAGADVWCDTRCIARELERRQPAPALMPPGLAPLATAVEAWAERDLFWPAVRFASGINADTMDPKLHVDRAAMRGKAAPSHERLRRVARRSLAQLRPPLVLVEDMLARGRPFLLADAPCQADLAVYHGLWFLTALEIDCSQELAPLKRTLAWMQRVAAVGHGRCEPMSPQEALSIAARSTPASPLPSIDDDALPPLGSTVSIRPEGYVTDAVVGELVRVDRFDLSVRRSDAVLGELTVHFPRVGYEVQRVDRAGGTRTWSRHGGQ